MNRAVATPTIQLTSSEVDHVSACTCTSTSTCLHARFTFHLQGESLVGVCRMCIGRERVLSVFLRIPLHTSAGPNGGTGISQ